MLKRTGRNIRKVILDPERKAAGSIPRAAKILTCLSGNINTVTDIAKQCKFAKSTVHRILKLLEDSYLVTEDPTNNRYYIGPLITRLTTNPSVLHEYLVRCAFEEMKRLSNITEETVSLDILLGIQAIPVYEIVSPHEIKVTDNSKKLGLVCTGASGKVLLSQLSEERLKVAMKYIVIPRATENTITDKNILVSQLTDIRQKGFAVSFGERIPGALCVSAPVHNYTSPAVLSIIGPEYRFKSRLETVVHELKISTSRVSRNVLEIFSSHSP